MGSFQSKTLSKPAPSPQVLLDRSKSGSKVATAAVAVAVAKEPSLKKKKSPAQAWYAQKQSLESSVKHSICTIVKKQQRLKKKTNKEAITIRRPKPAVKSTWRTTTTTTTTPSQLTKKTTVLLSPKQKLTDQDDTGHLLKDDAVTGQQRYSRAISCPGRHPDSNKFGESCVIRSGSNAAPLGAFALLKNGGRRHAVPRVSPVTKKRQQRHAGIKNGHWNSFSSTMMAKQEAPNSLESWECTVAPGHGFFGKSHSRSIKTSPLLSLRQTKHHQHALSSLSMITSDPTQHSFSASCCCRQSPVSNRETPRLKNSCAPASLTLNFGVGNPTSFKQDEEECGTVPQTSPVRHSFVSSNKAGFLPRFKFDAENQRGPFRHEQTHFPTLPFAFSTAVPHSPMSFENAKHFASGRNATNSALTYREPVLPHAGFGHGKTPLFGSASSALVLPLKGSQGFGESSFFDHAKPLPPTSAGFLCSGPFGGQPYWNPQSSLLLDNGSNFFGDTAPSPRTAWFPKTTFDNNFVSAQHCRPDFALSQDNAALPDTSPSCTATVNDVAATTCGDETACKSTNVAEISTFNVDNNHHNRLVDRPLSSIRQEKGVMDGQFDDAEEGEGRFLLVKPKGSSLIGSPIGQSENAMSRDDMSLIVVSAATCVDNTLSIKSEPSVGPNCFPPNQDQENGKENQNADANHQDSFEMAAIRSSTSFSKTSLSSSPFPQPCQSRSCRATSKQQQQQQQHSAVSFDMRQEGSFNHWQWARQYNALVDFKHCHGHTSVPSKYENNPSLGAWVQKQRFQYKRGKMPDYRIDFLNAIGFLWKAN